DRLAGRAVPLGISCISHHAWTRKVQRPDRTDLFNRNHGDRVRCLADARNRAEFANTVKSLLQHASANPVDGIVDATSIRQAADFGNDVSVSSDNDVIFAICPGELSLLLRACRANHVGGGMLRPPDKQTTEPTGS